LPERFAERVPESAPQLSERNSGAAEADEDPAPSGGQSARGLVFSAAKPASAAGRAHLPADRRGRARGRIGGFVQESDAAALSVGVSRVPDFQTHGAEQ
jgi:hypothetical protein